MMPAIAVSALGLIAAALTSLSYIPQVRKALPRHSTNDLSLKTLSALSAGLGLWIMYGLVVHDLVVAVANTVGFALSTAVLACKLRDMRSRSE
jgi:MtN3 and saliva related transmembrane protein